MNADTPTGQSDTTNPSDPTTDAIQAAAFRRLLAHLDDRKDVQNIDLMNLAGFCRNCLSKWYRAEAEKLGEPVTDAAAREAIYGMPYDAWKALYQTPAGPKVELDGPK